MWYGATIATPATDPIVTDVEAKAQLRVDHSDEDTLIGSIRQAACAHVELYCGVRFNSQTLTLKCDAFADFARLPEGPIASITSITYVDVDGATQTLATSVYELRADGYEAAIVLKFNQSWPTPRVGSQITVTAVAGAAAAPADVKAATLLLIGHLYANREAAGEALAVIPMGVDALLANHRRYA
jgi:uncharacterized phiE125 gp8 family phage protein